MKNACIALVLIAAAAANATEAKMKSDWKKLSTEEARVIVDKGTERPFSGRYEKQTDPGVYTCRRCGAALYRSENKFDAHCGWPAFDDQIPGAVVRKPDADGSRTEIECANCGGHLGHVFTGEQLTPANTRYCVNSISMDFVPKAELERRFDYAIFAGGCFWGVEYFLEQAKGVIRADSGYTGGTVESPTYEQVCSGKTGHLEAVKVLFDPQLTSYETLAKLFFEIHDPTQVDRQGPDIGTQYRSAVFYRSEAQKVVVEKLVAKLKASNIQAVTRLEPEKPFWPAELYHQDYYSHKGSTPYCHRRVKRFD